MAKINQKIKLKNADAAAAGKCIVTYVTEMLSATEPVMIEVHISGLSSLNTEGRSARINTI